ncbi:ferrochelatase [Bacillus massiliigorillae]|uniref:ferrochelatase n=1 Tax=Bacillus massiliigorillae TaxID=1243664 RepID=UPI0003A1D8D5|nr:ferrochelatase [Bacillus massiliigorillae]
MEKTAILLVNLGTPDEPTPASVRTYLNEFLSDRRVIDLPRIQWLPVLHGIILRVRPKKSAELYKSIWAEQGSPLLLNSQKQHAALQQRFRFEHMKVALAMNYGNPSVSKELDKLHKWGVRKLIVLPLFPQYSSSTTASVWDNVVITISKWRDVPELVFIRDFPDHPLFIDLLTNRIKECITKNGDPDCVVLSYHGIPVRYADTGDDYPKRCQKTTAAIQKQFPNVSIIECYQSKFGKEPWIEPSTSETLQALAQQGKKHVIILAPSFTADCLETLEELEEENKNIFMEAGGESYHYLPAANDDPLFIDALEDIICKYIN